jgi:probable HAF family extracellular repeat protein
MRGLNYWSVLLTAGHLFLGMGLGYAEVIDLGTLGGPERNGVAFAINDRGEAAGYTDKSDGIVHAFLYSDGVMTDLGTFGGGLEHGPGDQ